MHKKPVIIQCSQHLYSNLNAPEQCFNVVFRCQLIELYPFHKLINCSMCYGSSRSAVFLLRAQPVFVAPAGSSVLITRKSAASPDIEGSNP